MKQSRAYWRQRAAMYARRHGVPVALFLEQIKMESGFNPNARSPAGAQGIAQIMPFHGVGTNPDRQLDWAAAHMASTYKKYGNWRDALSVYNSGRPWSEGQHIGETRHYVDTIMGVYHSSGKQGAPSARVGRGPGLPGSPGFTVESVNAPDLAGVALSNLSQMSSQGGHFDPMAGLDNLIGAIQDAGTTTTHVPGEAPTPGADAGGAPKGGWQKYVRVRPGADRKGVVTVNGVRMFVGELGQALGRRLTITTGTQHNQYVVGTTRQSAHWTGRAADIAMSGRALTRAGQRALILAGMDPRQARKIKGGLFNIGGYQIIFNTNEGGNHWNHLHIGLRH